MLQLQNLKISVEGKEILKGVSLDIRPGEIHAIMGPNGSGKSTLAHALMGHPKYQLTGGQIFVDKEAVASTDGETPVNLSPDKRAYRGLFLAFQYPEEIPGVSVTSFLKTAYTSLQKARGETPMNIIEFRKLLRGHLQAFNMDVKFLNRDLNDGFSGGEKKKMEILQMALLQPKYAVLDETDSGLDVDALKIVADGINRLAAPNRSILLITHYQRILHYVKPHFVHVMMDGHIIESGNHELAEKLEKEGYSWIREKYALENSHDVRPIPFENTPLQPYPSTSTSSHSSSS